MKSKKLHGKVRLIIILWSNMLEKIKNENVPEEILNALILLYQKGKF